MHSPPFEDGLLSPRLDVTFGYLLTMYCPGCKMLHSIGVDHPKNTQAKWGWDGDFVNPTFTPSIAVHMPWLDTANRKYICHSFIRAGKWEFLSDCAHDLAGQTVDMVDIPEDL